MINIQGDHYHSSLNYKIRRCPEEKVQFLVTSSEKQELGNHYNTISTIRFKICRKGHQKRDIRVHSHSEHKKEWKFKESIRKWMSTNLALHRARLGSTHGSTYDLQCLSFESGLTPGHCSQWVSHPCKKKKKLNEHNQSTNSLSD